MKLKLCFFNNPTAPSTDAEFVLSPPPPPPKLLLSDTSISPNSSNNNSSSTTPTSLHSELSLQSHPSLPSLQLRNYYSSLLETSPSSPAASSSSLVLSNLPFPISTLALSCPFLYAASGPTLYVFSSSSLSLLHSFPSNSSSSAAPIKSISFSRQNNTTNRRLLVLTAHQDGRIRVWLQPNHLDGSSSQSHRLLAVLPTAADRIRRCAVPSNYVSVRRHKKRLWLHHNDAVSALATTTTSTNDDSINDGGGVGGGLVYSVSWDKSLKVWCASDFKCLESIPAHEDAVNAVAVSPSEGVVYTGSADGRIRVWRTANNRPVDRGEKSSSSTKIKHCLIATLEKHRSAVNALALMTDPRSKRTVLFSGACDRSIVVWERKDGGEDVTASSSAAGGYSMVATGALRGHEKAILCLVAVGDVLVSGSADRTVRMWRRSSEDGSKFCCLAVLEGHQKPVRSVQAKKVVDEMEGDVDGQRDGTDVTTSYSVFSGSLDGEIRAWQVKVTSSSSSTALVAGIHRRGAGDGNNEDVSFLYGAVGGRCTADTSVYPNVDLW